MERARECVGTAALAALCSALASACILPSYEEDPAAPPPGSSLAPLWTRRLGGVMDDTALDVAVAGKGNVILAGRFKSRMSFDGDQTLVGPADSGDAFVAKYDDKGTSLFALTFGDSTSAQEASTVSIDPANGDVIIGGNFFGMVTLEGLSPLTAGAKSSAIIARLSAGGVPLWARGFVDTASPSQCAVRPNGVAVDSQGDVLVAGQWCGSVDFSAGDTMPGMGQLSDTSTLTYDVFIMKRDGLTGDLKWVVPFYTNGNVVASGLAVDSSDNVLVTGFYEGTASFTDTQAQQVTIGAPAVGRDLYAAQLDSDGGYLWTFGFDDGGQEEGSAIAVDGADNALVTGFASHSVDGDVAPAGRHAIAIKIGIVGDMKWQVSLPGLDLDTGHDIAADAAGDVLLTGRRRPFPAAGIPAQDDVLLALLGGADGAIKATTSFGSHGEQFGAGLVLDEQDNVIVAGGFEEELDFGGGALVSKGDLDIFVAKLRHP